MLANVKREAQSYLHIQQTEKDISVHLSVSSSLTNFKSNIHSPFSSDLLSTNFIEKKKS